MSNLFHERQTGCPQRRQWSQQEHQILSQYYPKVWLSQTVKLDMTMTPPSLQIRACTKVRAFSFISPQKCKRQQYAFIPLTLFSPQRCEEIGSARTSFPDPDKRQRIREN
ncbi:hypothetical protein [Citrobacter sp. MNAZ 1397]|uniref:hypothetical protein n=1 Tax=Citrobacter sp. MNAZ 1397 TaxID=2911205 RepID=UPI002025DEDC|nr:hypothetical protein [Citrobacter sp. MNAZ 1397]MCL9670313.1 hypothetical protein [Citrobacter sp. MNAZ 1397]